MLFVTLSFSVTRKNGTRVGVLLGIQVFPCPFLTVCPYVPRFCDSKNPQHFDPLVFFLNDVELANQEPPEARRQDGERAPPPPFGPSARPRNDYRPRVSVCPNCAETHAPRPGRPGGHPHTGRDWARPST